MYNSESKVCSTITSMALGTITNHDNSGGERREFADLRESAARREQDRKLYLDETPPTEIAIGRLESRAIELTAI
jgi:hypothetical protein